MLPGILYEIETDDPAEVPGWEPRYVEAIGRLGAGTGTPSPRATSCTVTPMPWPRLPPGRAAA